jgi:aquaporin Z
MFRKLAAEFFGTFWLIFAVLGTALFAAGFPTVGVGFLGVAFAAGLAVMTMAYAVGPISGGHFNPAVSLGLAVAGRFAWKDLIPYWIAQLVGGIVAAVIIYAIASGKSGFTAGGFASNGYDALSPGGYSMVAVFLVEVVLTAAFIMVILGATSKAASAGFGPIAIGLALTVVHLIGIPVSNASVNPARSIAERCIAAGLAVHRRAADRRGARRRALALPIVAGRAAGAVGPGRIIPATEPLLLRA